MAGTESIVAGGWQQSHYPGLPKADMEETYREASELADEYLAFIERLLKFLIGSLLLSLLVVLFWHFRGSDNEDEEQ